MNTVSLFWHFSKFFKRLVYESSGEDETPPHSVSPSFLFLFLSAVYMLSCLSDCLTTCLPLTVQIINSVAVPSVVLHLCGELQDIKMNELRLMQTWWLCCDR